MKKNLVTKQKQQGYSDRNAVGGAIFSRDALNQKILSLLGRNQLVFEQKPKHLKGIFC